MRRNLASVLVAALVLMLGPFRAGATGDIAARLVESTNIDNVIPCRGGQIFEELYEGGHVPGYWDTYLLACITSADSAEWVLVSGLNAENVASCRKSKEPCFPRDGKWVPNFNDSPDGWQSGKGEPPFRMAYNLWRYRLGKSCKLSIAAGGGKGWTCERFDFYDGAKGPVHKWRSIRLETLSSKSMDRNYDPPWAGVEMSGGPSERDGLSIAYIGGPSPEDGDWVELTRPMVGCHEGIHDREPRKDVWLALQAWAEDKEIPSDCVMIEKGRRLQLAPDQEAGVTELREWCKECSPDLVTYFTPPRKIAGDYLKPIAMPKGMTEFFDLSEQ